MKAYYWTVWCVNKNEEKETKPYDSYDKAKKKFYRELGLGKWDQVKLIEYNLGAKEILPGAV